MRSRSLAYRSTVISLFAVVSASLVAAQRTDLPRPGAPERREHLAAPISLEGLVLAPGGAPAEGVLVVSSAGGRAVTDARGRYRLTVDVPIEAESVRVTALAAGSARLAASTLATPSWTASTASVDPLTLALGVTCSPSWLPTFGQMPGTDDRVSALAVFDDGSGPALYAGGRFATAGGVLVRFIARWDGLTWSALGAGVNNGVVQALAVYDDGSGPALYAAGTFNTAGAGPANRIAKWDGASWTALGSGLDDAVLALTVYDAGGGPALYAGGSFLNAGGAGANHVAKWDGSSWSPLGSGTNGQRVTELATYDDGSGAKLYAAGGFTTAGGGSARGIAAWNGSSWSALGLGVVGTIADLEVFDDGGGPALYVAGSIQSAGSVSPHNTAKWDGSTWSALGSGTNDFVSALAVYDDGDGPALYAGGWFSMAGGLPASRLARWDGASWSAAGSGTNDAVEALAVHDAKLFAAGSFTSAADEAVLNIAGWDGATWASLGKGLGGGHYAFDPPPYYGYVSALVVYDDGSGPALYAGGLFSTVGGIPVANVAKWDGASWMPLGGGVCGFSSWFNPYTAVWALAVYDAGDGPALYVGGSFTDAGGTPVSNIAKWDGTSWSALGMGISGLVYALAVHDDGGGPALYAGGYFSSAGGAPANWIARWNGASWSALGSGTNDYVNALAVYDDGAGAALYAAGNFTTAGGGSARRVAKWNGASWSRLGPGTDAEVRALAVFDDGSGPALYAGGEFSTAGGNPASRIARWNGAGWSALGSGVSAAVNALAAHDDGSGPALYAGGEFSTAGGGAALRLARWDGVSWSALGSGASGTVSALARFDDGGGTALYAGGWFESAFDSLDSHIAKWGCPDSIPPVLTCPPDLVVRDVDSDGQEIVTFTVTAVDGVDPAPMVDCVPPSGSVFPLGTTLVTCTAEDADGNTSSCQFSVTVRTKVRPR
jgi:hypothetical protein